MADKAETVHNDNGGTDANGDGDGELRTIGLSELTMPGESAPAEPEPVGSGSTAAGTVDLSELAGGTGTADTATGAGGPTLDLSDLIMPDDACGDMGHTAGPKKQERGIMGELYDKLFGESWAMWIGSIILAILSVFLFVIASPWGSSGGLLNWGQNLFGALGMQFPESLPNGLVAIGAHQYGILSVVMVLGALGSALLAKEFAIRISPPGESAKGLIGGVLMGIGAILALGCTVGNFFCGWAALSGAAFIFAGGLVIGTFLAVKYLVWEMVNHPNVSGGKARTYLAAKSSGRSRQPIVGAVVLGLGASIALFYDSGIDKVLIGFVLIGLVIGAVLQRSRWCIVRSLREHFMTGSSEGAVAIITGILVALAGFTVIKVMGVGGELTMVAGSFWVPAIVGGVIFGFGMTIAGGCTVGATWRAGEGHTKLWLALVGIVVAAPLTAEFIRPGFVSALPAQLTQPVFLPNSFTYLGAVVIVLLLLTLWYLLAKWNERTCKLCQI